MTLQNQKGGITIRNKLSFPFANYPDVKPVLTAKIEPLTVDQAQYIADLWVRSQGDSALARLLDYFIGKCFDVKIGNSFNGDFNVDFDVQQ